MTPLATVFYWVVGGELTMCLIVLAAMLIRRLYYNHVARKWCRILMGLEEIPSEDKSRTKKTPRKKEDV